MCSISQIIASFLHCFSVISANITINHILLKTRFFGRQNFCCVQCANFYAFGPTAAKFGRITQNNGYSAVQGYSRSPILVPSERSYTTYFWWIILRHVVSCTVSKLLWIICRIFAFDRGTPLLTHSFGSTLKLKTTKFGVRKLETYPDIWCEKYFDIFYCFGVAHKCDRQIDRTACSNSALYSALDGRYILHPCVAAAYLRGWTENAGSENGGPKKMKDIFQSTLMF